MGAGNPRAAQHQHLSPEQLNSDKIDILGKQIWRVIPYGMKYKKRALVGILANGLARFADLLPFVLLVSQLTFTPAQQQMVSSVVSEIFLMNLYSH